MLSQWLQQARNGQSVWLSDVREQCAALPDHVAVTVQLTLCDGARRDFSLPIPHWADGEQRQFVQQYVTAFVFNALSALSGREMAFCLDLRETEVVALLGELDDIFQVRQTARSGYGKVVNIANRLCRAFGGGTFSFPGCGGRWSDAAAAYAAASISAAPTSRRRWRWTDGWCA